MNSINTQATLLALKINHGHVVDKEGKTTKATNIRIEEDKVLGEALVKNTEGIYDRETVSLELRGKSVHVI